MTLEEGRRFLAGEGIPFAQLHFENERAYWADVCFWDNGRPGKEEPVEVLRICAPNGRRHLDLQFLGEEFSDLWFGGFSFELWDSTDLLGDLLHYIRQVIRGGSYCNVWNRQRLAGDGYFSEEDGDISFREELGWRYGRKNPEERRWIRVRLREELYNWNEYHKFER